ncbi:MAG: hypothetical protein ACRC1K_00885 [Planctomycetia bacterium]
MPIVEVLKIGGSLLERADLSSLLTDRLSRRAAALGRAEGVLVIAGGGPAADVVRSYARRHPLPEAAAHLLAVRAMGLNIQMLAALAPALGSVVKDLSAVDGPGPFTAFDPTRSLERDAGATLPVGWHVTSDSIAAWLARRVESPRVTLAKSVVDLPEAASAKEAVERGWVDSWFPVAASGVETVLESWTDGRCCRLT